MGNQETETTAPDETPMGSEILAFASHIDSLRQTLPMTMMLVQAFDKGAGDKLREFENDNCQVHDEGDTRSVTIPYEHLSRWNKLKHRRDQGHHARRLVPRSIFVSLLSEYDAFLGKVLRLIFIERPGLLNESKREIAFSDLVQFPTIDAAREFIIAKEIETVLRMSHIDQFKWMENKFGLALTKLEAWPKFVELTQRRNLFVHADGLVSKQYLSECREAGCKMDPEVREGTVLGVPQKYFDEACTLVLEVGIKLAHVLWRKLIPGQLEDADKNLNELAFDLIQRPDYPLSIALLEFAVSVLKKYSDESRRLIFVVNLAQAYKWHDQMEECCRILDSEDWSAIGEEFKLAESVLREDWAKSAATIRRIGPKGRIGKIEYRDWPVFKELRSRKEFLEAYQDVFGEPYLAPVESKTTEAQQELMEHAPSAGRLDGEEAQSETLSDASGPSLRT
jgi:hypothetical protein